MINFKFNEYWDTGLIARLVIFTLLPLPLLIIPNFIKDTNKEKNKISIKSYKTLK